MECEWVRKRDTEREIGEVCQTGRIRHWYQSSKRNLETRFRYFHSLALSLYTVLFLLCHKDWRDPLPLLFILECGTSWQASFSLTVHSWVSPVALSLNLSRVCVSGCVHTLLSVLYQLGLTQASRQTALQGNRTQRCPGKYLKPYLMQFQQVLTRPNLSLIFTWIRLIFVADDFPPWRCAFRIISKSLSNLEGRGITRTCLHTLSRETWTWEWTNRILATETSFSCLVDLSFFSSNPDMQHKDLKQLPRRKHYCVAHPLVSSERKEFSNRNSGMHGCD